MSKNTRRRDKRINLQIGWYCNVTLKLQKCYGLADGEVKEILYEVMERINETGRYQ